MGALMGAQVPLPGQKSDRLTNVATVATFAE